MARCVIGVDLGGTNVRAGAFYEDGSPAGKQFENPSHAQKGTEAIFDALAGTIRQAMGAAESKPEAVGLAIPGHIDNAAGIVRWAPNFGQEVDGIFESWFDVPVRAPLSKHIDIPIFMDNDANMAALGEYRYGCGRGTAKSFVMVTMGTGIGGGVILSPDAVLGDARGPLVLVGGNKGGAELGHIIVNMDGLDCNAGTYGTVEAYCQRDAIVKRAQYKIIRGRPSALTTLSEGNSSSITPRMIFEACEAGDEVAIETFPRGRDDPWRWGGEPTSIFLLRTLLRLVDRFRRRASGCSIRFSVRRGRTRLLPFSGIVSFGWRSRLRTRGCSVERRWRLKRRSGRSN